MTVRIDVDQIRSVEEGPLYRVATTVNYTTGIDRSIFVFNTETEAFEHVATPWDIDNLPTSKRDATLANLAFYRMSTITKDWDVVASALEFASYTLSRIADLARSYETSDDAFVGDGSYSYTGA